MGFVYRYEEMSWGHATLSSQLGYQEEVVTLVTIHVLNKAIVNDSAWLWVHHLLIIVLDEHSLIDPLVDHDKSNKWWVHVVESVLEDGSDLRYLGIHDLLAHLVAYTISVDDDLLGVRTDILVEFIKGTVEDTIQVLLDDLLVFGLTDDI